MLVIFVSFRAEAERRRNIRDSRGVEVRLGYARSNDVVSLGCQKANDGLLSRVAEREDHPARVRARRFCRDGHASGNAVSTRRGFDAQLVAAALIEFTEKGDIDFLVVGPDDDRLHSSGGRRHTRQRYDKCGYESRESCPPPERPLSRRLQFFPPLLHQQTRRLTLGSTRRVITE